MTAFTSNWPVLICLVALVGGCTFIEVAPPPECDPRTAFYPDADGDGFGEPTAVYIGCDAPDGWVSSLEDPPVSTGDTGA